MAQKVNNYLDRIEEECEQYRSDASRAVKDLYDMNYALEGDKKEPVCAPNELYEDDKVRKGIQDKFNRIHLYSEDDKKAMMGCNKKLALTAFTNDTMQSEVDRVESDDIKLLNAQITKLEDMINKMSNGGDEELNAIVLRGLENINSKLDAVVVAGSPADQQATDSAKPVSSTVLY